MKFDIDSIRRVLILMPDKHLGNLVVSLPAIRALRDSFTDRSLFLVIDESYKDILESFEGLDTILLYPRKQLRECSSIKRLWIFPRFVRQIRKLSADITIDLEGRQTSSILTLLSGARLRVGRSTAKLAKIYNREVILSTGKHKVHNYTDIAEAVGCPRVDVNLILRAAENKRISLSNILRDEGINMDAPTVCIHPGAGKVYKQWHSENFADIVDWLSSEGFQVVFIGSSVDSDKIRDIKALSSAEPYCLDGRLSLGELMALFEQSSIFIGNDSGPMHLAAAMGIPVIALFSTADENRWKPLSEKSVALRGESPCEVCNRKNCEFDFKCINALSPDKVKSIIRAFLQAKQ